MVRFTQAVLFASICLACSFASAQYGYQLPISTGDQHSNLERALVQDSGQAKLADLGELVLTIKNQIKEAIKEVISQVVDNLKDIFYSLKLKLFKKLGKMTIFDAFRSLFGGVSDFVQTGGGATTLYATPGINNLHATPGVKPVESAYAGPNPVYGPQMYWHLRNQ